MTEAIAPTLAIDTGAVAGWAFRSGDTLVSGVWELAPGYGRAYRTKWANLWFALSEIHQAHQPKRVVYEDVKRHAGTLAAHAFGGSVAVLQMWCELNHVSLHTIGVGTVKKHATGKGNASKAAMVEAAHTKWPEQRATNHNQADSLHILDAWLAGARQGGNDV